VLGFTLCCALLFVAAASQLNRLTLLLSPVALAIVFFYSLTKRFTRWSHLFLGLALSISPTAAWIAVTGALDPRILVLTLAVLFWVAGFDILYACQDVAFDREARLWSLPAAVGIARAFFYARTLHLVMILLLLWLVVLFHLGGIGWVGCAVVAALLLWEHSLVSPQDMRKLNAAFFTMNGVISMLYFLFVAAAVLLHR
jgi:4-hydroxybenzoate polyprenyltransferase